MAKTKVLFLIHTLQVGGAEKALVTLVNNLDPHKFDITVMTVIDTGAFRQKLAKNIHYETIVKPPRRESSDKDPRKSGNLLQGKGSNIRKHLAKLYQFAWRHIDTRKIYEKHITEKYDVEVAFLEGIATKIIASSNNKNSKKIAWVHVDLLEEPKSDKFFRNHSEESSIYQSFDQIVAVSNTVKSQFEKKFNYNPQKVIVRYNPIDASDIKDKSKQEAITTNQFTICTVGRLSAQKGYDRLLKVVNRLNKENLLFNLWIIGVGAEEPKLAKYITENHLNNVHLLGYKSNPYPYIKAADLYVCSSRAEGFSTTVSESIILGTPVVSTNCSGAREILGDSKYGIVCNNTEDALYKTIKKLLTDKKEYAKRKAQAALRSSFFDISQSMPRISSLIEEVHEARV